MEQWLPLSDPLHGTESANGSRLGPSPSFIHAEKKCTAIGHRPNPARQQSSAPSRKKWKQKKFLGHHGPAKNRPVPLQATVFGSALPNDRPHRGILGRDSASRILSSRSFYSRIVTAPQQFSRHRKNAHRGRLRQASAFRYPWSIMTLNLHIAPSPPVGRHADPNGSAVGFRSARRPPPSTLGSGRIAGHGGGETRCRDGS